MYVLGLGDHVDCGSALLEDGQIIAAINDERLVREKMVFGVPRRSVRAILEMTGVTLPSGWLEVRPPTSWCEPVRCPSMADVMGRDVIRAERIHGIVSDDEVGS